MGKILHDSRVRRYRGVGRPGRCRPRGYSPHQGAQPARALVDFLVGDARAIDWCSRCEVTDVGSPYKAWTGVDTAWRLNEAFDDDGHRFDLINMQYAPLHVPESGVGASLPQKIYAALVVNGFGSGPVPCADRVREAANKRLALPKTCRITPTDTWKTEPVWERRTPSFWRAACRA